VVTKQSDRSPAEQQSGASPTARVGRVTELDAVRGLAAVIVVLDHSAVSFPATLANTRADSVSVANVFKYTPLHALWSGLSAVVLFFVLSGFVLHLSYGRGARQTVGGFMVRRVSRIWVPYAIWVGAAMVLSVLLGGEHIPALSSWFNIPWQKPLDAAAVAEHALLVGSFDDGQYVPAIWSLVHEMRISLVFPLLVGVTLTLGWRRGLMSALPLACLGYATSKVWSPVETVMYLLCFAVGILLAEHRHAITLRLTHSRRGTRLLLAVGGALLFSGFAWTDERWFPEPIGRLAHLHLATVLAATASAAIFIALAQVPGRARQALRSRLPQFLGRISYSLYLGHTVVLLAIMHFMAPRIDPVALLVPIWMLSIALAAVSERWIERPAQALGRRTARRLERRATAPSNVATRAVPRHGHGDH
jgi:peptidoglycan/LPS O-acetylase OafA/YrhL